MRKEYDIDGMDSDYDGTTGGRPVLYAGVTWDFPTFTTEVGLEGFEVVLHTGSDPDIIANRVATIRRIADPTARDSDLKIPSAKSGTPSVKASVRAVFKFGNGPWTTSGSPATQTTGTVIVPGVSTVGAVSGSSNAAALSIGGTGNHTIVAHPADSTNPGVLTATAQTLGGVKTFAAQPVLPAAGIKFDDATVQTTAYTGAASGITQLTGDVTAGPGSGSQAATIPSNTITTAKVADDQITNAKLAEMATQTIKGNDSASTANPSDLSIAQVQALIGGGGGGGAAPTIADILVFGGGSDGDATISSGTTTLLRDWYYKNLTITGGKLFTNGFRLFVSEVLDISGAPSNAISGTGDPGGNGGVGGSTGAGGTSFNFAHNQFFETNGGGSAGGTGGTVNGSNSGTGLSGPNYVNGGRGGQGGQGGPAGANTPGNGSTPTAIPSAPLGRYVIGRLTTEPIVLQKTGISGICGGYGATGGGGGAGDGTAGGAGGGGGAGGLSMYIGARTVSRGSNSNTGIFQSIGGAGGTGGVPAGGNRGGGGGGAGAGGGWIIFAFRNKTGSAITGGIDVSGGTGGNGGNGTGTGEGGDGGASGESGLLQVYDVGAGTLTELARVASVAGGANSGATGGTGSSNTQRVNL
jgi:hypothetical protein